MKVVPVLRRRLILVLPTVLLLGLAGCGSESTTGASAFNTDAKDGLSAVSITGDVGSAPEVTWKTPMTASSTDTTTVVAGTGPKVAQGEQVLAQVWIGNGFSQQKAYSTFDGGPAQLIAADDKTSPAIAEALKDVTVGSRVAVTASATDAFGDGGNPTLGIGNEDAVLFVIDVVSEVRSEPAGTRHPAPGWMPAIQFTKGDPSGFDFTGSPKPAGQFRKAVLLEGDGAPVQKGQSVVADYLGQVYDGDMAFDENFTKTPTAFGLDGVIQGWAKSLVGVPVGSRIVLQVPPALGYGKTGNPQAKIEGTDTLFFVIDVLAAG